MRRFLILIIFLFAAFFVLPKNSFAKDYYFPKVSGAYNINADGSINVVEMRTYRFDGSFSYAYIDIPQVISRKGYIYNSKITNFLVTENGKPLTITEQTSGEYFHARWSYSAFNEQRTFTFSYKLLNALWGGADFDEFYWQVIGDKWDKRTTNADFVVTYPLTISKNQVYSFAHGPTNGKFDFISDNSVRFTVSDIPPKQFIEVRLVFPKGLVKSAVNSNKSLQAALDEEKSYVSPAVYKKYLLYALAFLNILWAVYWFYAWFKYGREYDHDTPKYLHDPPSNLPPALVEILLSQGNSVTTKSFIATLFDLANRKYLMIADRRVLKKRFLFGTSSDHEYAIIFKKSLSEIKTDIKLREYEKLLLEEIAQTLSVWTDEEKEAFGIKDESLAFKLSDLKESFKGSTFRSFWQDFEKEIKNEAKGLGFLEQGSEKRHNFFIASFVIIVVLDAIALYFFDVFHIFVFVGPFLVWGFIIGARLLQLVLVLTKSKKNVGLLGFMKRWSVAHGAEAKKWQALKNFLGDIGHFEEKMPHDLVLWERYLVYGALFGLTDKILKLMPVVLGEAVAPSWYVGSGGSFGTFSDFSSGMNSFSTSLNSNFSAGSGGGFSGGGGGGGGGGGAG